jgi:hypothetical protein
VTYGILLTATLSDAIYPSGLVLGGILISLLITREFLDAMSGVVALRWERYIRLICVPLALLFVVSVAARIAS